MDIYLINFNNLSDTDEFSSKIKRNKFHHKMSRVILKSILKSIYNIDADIQDSNGKPYIKDNSIYFSISHSEHLLGISFDKSPIGFDIEFMRKRNYKDILKYIGYKNINNNISKEDFFKLWTKYEAEYKSGIKNSEISWFKYRNYICSVSSTQNNLPKIYEIEIPRNNINDKELISLKLVNDSAKNENDVVIQEINIASSDLLSPPTLNIE